MTHELDPRAPAFLFVLLVLASGPSTQSRKLNAPLAQGHGPIQFPAVSSPDGRFALYHADRDGDGDLELYSVAPRGGAAPLLLCDDVRPLGSGYGPLVTLDGQSVLHVAGPDAAGSRTLLATPIAGGPPLVLASLPPGREARLSADGLSRDGQRLVFLADRDADDAFELFSVRVQGGTPATKLSGALVSGGDVRAFTLARDGSLALYTADQDADEQVELFVVPLDGSSPARRVHPPLAPGASVSERFFWFDGTLTNVVYLSQVGAGKFDLFSVPLGAGQPPLNLSGVRYWLPGSARDPVDFVMSPDSRWIVTLAVSDGYPYYEILSVAVDGSGVVDHHFHIERGPVDIQITPDSRWIVAKGTAVAIGGTGGLRGLGVGPEATLTFDGFSVVGRSNGIRMAPVDGSAPPVELSPPNTPIHAGFRVMADGVAYLAELEREGLAELAFSPLVAGQPHRKLAQGPVLDFAPFRASAFAPPASADTVLFLQSGRLHSVDALTGSSRVLDATAGVTTVGDVQAFDLSPDGRRVAFVAALEGDFVPELYSLSTEAGRDRHQSHAELAFGRVHSAHLSPDGRYVVYRASERASDDDPELYSSPTEGGPAVQLDLPSDLQVGEPVFAPAGDRLLYRSWNSGGLWSLSVVPAAGGALPVLVSGAVSVDPEGARFSPDGAWVVFPASSSLFAAPVDGSAPPVRISNGIVRPDFRFAGVERVLYRRVSGSVAGDLFVTPRDGSSPPLPLSALPNAFRTVTAFAAVGDRAVYAADQDALLQFQLFSVPLDGSAPPVALHGSLQVVEDVLNDLAVDEASGRVLYRLRRQGAAARTRLYSVPADGSATPMWLSINPGPVHSVSEFRIHPDGGRAVYMAEVEGITRLFSVPLDTPLGRVRLSRELVPGGDVHSFQVRAGSVAFTAERDAQGALALLAVPFRGQARARELSGPFQGSGSVLDYELSDDGTTVLFRADRDQPGVIELYLSRLGFDQRPPAR